MEIIKKAVDTMRVIAAETIQHAKSGHSGMAVGAAPLMYATYASMKIDPKKPGAFNRDRFVMSAGHGSGILYTTLSFMGIIPREELKTFRVLGGHLHGHPELNPDYGIDCSTGPLGQGVAMAVGLALAEKRLNQTDPKDVNHYTYCLVGDGCLQEGISYEATSLAGHYKLNKLIIVYDCNEVTLDGPRSASDSENVAMRFKAAGWNVIDVADGNDAIPVMAAIKKAKRSKVKPTIIIARTTIGYGTKVANSNKAHGSVISSEETESMRKVWGLKPGFFSVDKDVEEHFAQLGNSRKRVKNKNPFAKTAKKFDLVAEGKSMAMRDAGQLMLTQLSAQTPRLWGTNADIASSTKACVNPVTLWSDENPTGNMIACGIREFAMAGICNGLALHGFLPYCSTFLVFSDYLRSAIRTSALMDVPVTYIFSHDGLGTTPDGPTHQATEHIAALRLIPNLLVFRPSCDVECAMAFKYAFETQKPTVMILSRREVDAIKLPESADISKGAYLVHESETAKATILATGSEVSLALRVTKDLDVNVVSCPCVSLFEAQSKKYQKEVLGSKPVIALELGRGDMWYKHADHVIGFERFGGSGAEGTLRKELGFTEEQIAERIKELID